MGFVIFIAFILLSALVGNCAKDKGRSFWGFFWLSFFLSPIIGGIAVALSSRR